MTPAEHLPPDGTPLEAALYYASLGWRVLPIKPGAKSPPMNSWQHAATTDEQVIRNWYGGLYAGHGVGIATGRASGIFVLDVDVSGDKRGDESLRELEATYGPLPDTVRAITGSNGQHIILRHPPHLDIRNNASTRLGPGLDIRGEGGQVVAAPTVHPNGRTYTWEIGYGPDEIAVADAPDWLLQLLTVDPTPAPAKPAPPSGIAVGQEDSIAEHIRRSHRWHDLLYADGWKRGRGGKGDETMWVRPGKEAHEGASAVLHEPDGPFVVFSNDASLAALQRPEAATRSGDGWAWSIFGYIAATRYGGDRSACASAYRMALTADQAQIVTASRGQDAYAVLAGEPAPSDTDWEPIDLSTLTRTMRSGTYQPITPLVLSVEGGSPLLYGSRINSLFGESGGGKTWVALAAIAEVVIGGGHALMIDYEDNAAGIAERLMLLGLDDDEVSRLRYVNPSTSLGLGLAQLEQLAADCALVVLDSTGEAMAAGGTNPNADEEVARWFVLVKALTRAGSGPAVVVLDHVPKDKDAPSAYAIGSQRKRAAITGAAYRVDTLKEPAKGRDGKLRLTVAKDRPGHRAKGTTAAVVDIISGDGGTVAMRFHLSEAQVAAETGGKFRPTVLMERCSRWLEINPGVNKRTLLTNVQGKREALEQALDVLVDEGWFVVEDGPRGAKLYRVVRSYRELDDDHGGRSDGPDDDPEDATRAPAHHRGPTAAQRGSDPVDNSTRAPRPDRGPTAAQRGCDDPRTAAPPFREGRGQGPHMGAQDTEFCGPVDNSSPDLEMF